MRCVPGYFLNGEMVNDNNYMADKISDWIYSWDLEIFVVCTIVSTFSFIVVAIAYLISKT